MLIHSMTKHAARTTVAVLNVVWNGAVAGKAACLYAGGNAASYVDLQ